MSDNFKNQFDGIIESIDNYPFDTEQGWRDLSARIKHKKKRNIKVWYAAAGVIVAVGVVFGLINIHRANKLFIPAELEEAHIYYQHAIAVKLQQVKTEPGSELILNELEELDIIFKELSEDLKDQVQNEEVVQAMIETYRIKLAILERIVSELEEAKDEKRTEL